MSRSDPGKRRIIMVANGCGCGGDAKGDEAKVVEKPKEVKQEKWEKKERIVDHKVTLLIAAGAAMAANCEPCLNKIVPDLIEAGVHELDIRSAVEIGQFVKDKPAAHMKEVADLLTGSHLLKSVPVDTVCPADKMKEASRA
jgi:alkylhydroperoxidase/carboxymuconolactone decarboxylase family protein YurZ